MEWEENDMRVDFYNLWKEHKKEFTWQLIHFWGASYVRDPESERYAGLAVNEVIITLFNFQMYIRWD